MKKPFSPKSSALILLLISISLHAGLYFAILRTGLFEFANPLSAKWVDKFILADLTSALSSPTRKPVVPAAKPVLPEETPPPEPERTPSPPDKTATPQAAEPQATPPAASIPAPTADMAKTAANPPTNQQAAEPQPVVAAQPPPPPILPCAREQLDFDIYWMGVYVGSAVLEAVNKNDTLTITSRVRSNAVISAFYKVEDFAESTVKAGRPVSFKLRQHEGNHRGDKETVFDPANRKVSYLNHLRKTREEHATNDGVLWDVMSGFYYLRTQTLEEGRPVTLNIFDSNKFLKTEVKILRKERLTLADNREVDTLVVQPVLNSEGLFKRKGEIFIWLTDDLHRTPVKVQTTVAIGKVTAELRSSVVEK